MAQTMKSLSSEKTPPFLQPLSDPIFSRKDIFPELHLLDGPLKPYRYKSSFDWRKMKFIIESPDSWELKFNVWNYIEKNPLFTRSHETLPIDEERRLASVRGFDIYRQRFLTIERYLEKPSLAQSLATAANAYDPSVSVKFGLGFGMFSNVIMSLGTERVQHLAVENQEMKNFGCFALTEIAHGSNTQGMQTTATYDIESKSFILNTPSFEAAKCWVGNLGKTATHAIVYAQLYTPDGKCHGLNAYVVPIRDQKTMLAFPGVVVGDMGEKISLNGIDNGFVLFNNYKIPKDYLLSKTGDIDENGNFITQFKDPKKRMGMSFAALSGGRVGICEIAANYGVKAITIAVRYAASRKQFGPEGSKVEYPVIEYQAQQYRLIPHLAAVYATKLFSKWINLEYEEMIRKMFSGDKISQETGMEMHAVSSVGKPLCGWIVRDLIQDCREACGGHGYLKCARLGSLRDFNDPNCTYEGENNVLIQQSSNFLVSVRSKGWSVFENVSPLGSARFLKEGDKILASKWTWKRIDCAMKPENLLTTLNWICTYLLEKTYNRVKSLQQSGESKFDTRNNSQVFNAINLSLAYGYRQMFSIFLNEIQQLAASPERDVLSKLLSLFGANLIVTKYIGTLFEGGFVDSSVNVTDLLQMGIIELLPSLKDEAIALVDAIAHPDFIINSPLGMSDGNVYQHLQSYIYQTSDTFTRPSWWKEIVHEDFLQKASKL